MYALNITDEKDDFINCKDNEDHDINITIKSLLLSVLGSVKLLSVLTWISFDTHQIQFAVLLPDLAKVENHNSYQV